jgi:hypothetical protein
VGAPDTLELAAGRRAEILVGRGSPLAGVVLETIGDPPGALHAEGPGGAAAVAASGRLTLRFERASARHPMWWTDDDFWLYHVIVAAPDGSGGSLRLRLSALEDRVATVAAP